MRLALVSYEYPPETGFGGIGTYARQLAICLKPLGCEVEVFSASPNATTSIGTEDGIQVHRVRAGNREEFRRQIPSLVVKRHALAPFHLIETPEYGAEGVYVQQALPNVPLVVKFHTPDFLIKEMNSELKKTKLKYKLKAAIGWKPYKKEKDISFSMTVKAQGLISPSRSLASIIADRWGIPLSSIHVIPNPFIPSNEMLSIPPATDTKYITHLGRLETRKGVHLLANALPSVFQQLPHVRVRFIGRTNIGPYGKGTMIDYLKSTLHAWSDKIEFIDHISAGEVPSWLAKTDICVFNSLWENFPNVCLEAMSAARGIVASKNGGMEDMLEDINGGILVDPYDQQALINGIIHMFENPGERIAMGERSRQKIVNYYAKEVPEQLYNYYRSLIKD